MSDAINNSAFNGGATPHDGGTSYMPNGRKMRVAVLMGGTSSEREISLSTGRMIAGALDTDKYDVVSIDTQDLLFLGERADTLPAPADVTNGKLPAFSENATGSSLVEGAAATEGAALSAPTNMVASVHSVVQNTPDIVFIALHGRGGEDGAVQGLLETLGLPYTGSGILASALAMDKAMSKQLFRGAGIPVAPEIMLRRDQNVSNDTLITRIDNELGGFPVFVKPNAEGSTVGGTMAHDASGLSEAAANAFRYDMVILIEKYLRGMESTVGVLGNTGGALQALPVVEIVPKSAFYDYESKYAAGGSDHVIPARLTDALTEEVQQLALRCHALLGCRGMSRTDFIITPDGPFVLEVNTIPGMTPTSLLPDAAAHAGITFPDLLDLLIASALAD